MRNKISGGIGILWGGAIVVRWLMTDSPSANSAFQAGQSGAAVLGFLMLAAGVYYFFKKPGE